MKISKETKARYKKMRKEWLETRRPAEEIIEEMRIAHEIDEAQKKWERKLNA